MNVLDENIVAQQRDQLRQWRITFRRVGEHLAVHGASDENLIPVLHRLKQRTFFTHAEDFFAETLCHPYYATMHLNVCDNEAAEFIRRFLKHPQFNAQTKRLGIVARVSASGVQFWRTGKRGLQRVEWKR